MVDARKIQKVVKEDASGAKEVYLANAAKLKREDKYWIWGEAPLKDEKNWILGMLQIWLKRKVIDTDELIYEFWKANDEGQREYEYDELPNIVRTFVENYVIDELFIPMTEGDIDAQELFEKWYARDLIAYCMWLDIEIDCIISDIVEDYFWSQF